MMFKKHAAKAKESEDADENKSDPTPFSLRNFSCEWLIEESSAISYA